MFLNTVSLYTGYTNTLTRGCRSVLASLLTGKKVNRPDIKCYRNWSNFRYNASLNSIFRGKITLQTQQKKRKCMQKNSTTQPWLFGRLRLTLENFNCKHAGWKDFRKTYLSKDLNWSTYRYTNCHINLLFSICMWNYITFT